MTIKISFPDIPKRTAKLSHSDTWGDTICRQDFINNISGPRYSVASMQSSKTGLSRSNYDLGETTAAVDHLVIGRADLLQADDVKSVRLRGSRQSAFLPSSISGLKLWLDANRGVTTVSGAVSQWDDLSGNGNHATQGTAANRPCLSRYDNKGNVAVYSRTFTNAKWTKNLGSATDNYATNYDNTITAGRFIATAGAGDHKLQLNSSGYISGVVAASGSYVLTGWFKYVNSQYVWFGDGADGPWHGANIDIQNGTIQNTTNLTASNITSVGNGFYKIELTYTRTSGGNIGIYSNISFSGVTTGSSASFVAVGTEEYLIGGVSYRFTTWDTDDIITTDAPEFAGINSSRSIVFDGVNDHLFCNSIGSLLAGSDTPFSLVIFSRSNEANATLRNAWGLAQNASTAYMRYDLDNALNVVRRREDAGTSASANGGVNDTSNNIWSVVFTGTAISIYKNGSIVINSAALNVGTTSFDRFAIGAGYFAGALLNYFLGYIGEVLVYDSVLSSTDRENIEQYLIDKWTLAPTVKTHTLSTDTLTNNDLVLEPSTTSSAYRHWWLEMESDAASKFTHSKIYFGQWLDMGETIEDVRVIKGLDLNDAFTTDAGARKLAKSKQSKYQIEITWSGLTDAKVKSFIESVAAQTLLNNSFYLYAGSNSDQLNGNSLLYCKLVEWSFPAKEKLDYNTIRATFEELD